jgi:hypothetical protein
MLTSLKLLELLFNGALGTLRIREFPKDPQGFSGESVSSAQTIHLKFFVLINSIKRAFTALLHLLKKA